MRRANLWKGILIAIFIIAAFWQLYPTWQLQHFTEKEKAEISKETLNKMHAKALHLGLDLQGGMNLVLEIEKKGLAKALEKNVSDLTEKEISDATDRALEIVRNRIDQFGVSEPVIQRQGKDRIGVQLPGVERERAKVLIGKTALLEFKLVQEPAVFEEIVGKIDKRLIEIQKASTSKDTLEEIKQLSHLLTTISGEVGVLEEDKHLVEAILADTVVSGLIPPDLEFAWGESEEKGGLKGRHLYLLKKEPEITGAGLKDARMGIGTDESPTQLRVDFVLTRRVAGVFSRVTAANINRRLAIVLDEVVKSAPVIRSRIPDGRGMITMGSQANSDEARDLAIVLRAGALPAPLVPIEERSVGPTLGLDSIRKGIKASLFGAMAVVVFMIIYYALSGLFANLALTLNLLFLLAIMAGFRATLTLPGLAGIVLAIGMAVDANVLIFERIREELRTGKTVRASIEAGYKRAFATILDSNVTTVMGAIALFWFGSGPIKGFATTLIIGICVSMFTAIVVTRMIFDFITTRFNIQKLSI
ncbi:MAG: protein translocase subunit SecD [Candidatus Edwardsbacteria bacterium]